MSLVIYATGSNSALSISMTLWRSIKLEPLLGSRWANWHQYNTTVTYLSCSLILYLGLQRLSSPEKRSYPFRPIILQNRSRATIEIMRDKGRQSDSMTFQLIWTYFGCRHYYQSHDAWCYPSSSYYISLYKGVKNPRRSYRTKPWTRSSFRLQRF